MYIFIYIYKTQVIHRQWLNSATRRTMWSVT